MRVCDSFIREDWQSLCLMTKHVYLTNIKHLRYTGRNNQKETSQLEKCNIVAIVNRTNCHCCSSTFIDFIKQRKPKSMDHNGTYFLHVFVLQSNQFRTIRSLFWANILVLVMGVLHLPQSN